MGVWSDIAETITNRVKSPVLGSISLSFFAVNWKEIIYLIFETKVSLTNRIQYFEDNTDGWSLLFWPVLIGCLLALAAPYLTFGLSKAIEWPTLQRRLLGVVSAAKIQQKKNELEELEQSSKINRAKFEAEQEEIERRRILEEAKANSKVEEIEDPDAKRKAQMELTGITIENDVFLTEKMKLDLQEFNSLAFDLHRTQREGGDSQVSLLFELANEIIEEYQHIDKAPLRGKEALQIRKYIKRIVNSAPNDVIGNLNLLMPFN